MSTLMQTHLGIADAMKLQDRAGGVLNVIEVLNQAQEVTKDIPWMECNEGARHIHAVRSGLTDIQWGSYYQGIAKSKADVQQVTDVTGFCEASSGVDVRLLKRNKNPNELRNSQAKAHIERMGQEAATALFYHDPATNPLLPKGLGPRYGALATSGAGHQIIDGGGTGSDNCSVWFVTWGENSVFGLYPEGTTGGLMREDKGEQRVLDASGNHYFEKEEDFRWDMGFAVADYRNVVRIANIDVSELAAGNVDLYALLRKGYYRLNSRRVGKIDQMVMPGRTVIYCNTEVKEAMDALDTGNSNRRLMNTMDVQGEEVDTYRKMPVRETDALILTETRVV